MSETTKEITEENEEPQVAEVVEQVPVDANDQKLAKSAIYKKLFSNPLNCLAVIPSFFSACDVIFNFFFFSLVLNELMHFYDQNPDTDMIMKKITNIICWQVFASILFGIFKFLNSFACSSVKKRSF